MVDAQAGTQSRSGLRLALLAFAQFIIAIDYNIVYVALPDIGRELGFTAQSLQWVVSAYAVGFGGLLLFGGRAVDRLGARRMFILAVLIYGVSSFVGGIATAPGVLVAARAVQGLGGALLFPAILTLLFTGFEEGAQRNRAMAVWGATGSAGLAAGSLMGGLLTDFWGWEAVFFVNVPLALIAALAAPKLLPADPKRSAGGAGFDFPGALLATAGMSLVVFGLARGPETQWRLLESSGALVLGVLLLAVLVVVEARTKDPLIPLRLLRNRNLVTTMVVIFLFMGTLASGYYVYTTYLQPVLGYTPLQAGLAFLPLALVSMAAGKVAAVLLNKWGVRATLFVGLIVNGVGVAALASVISVDGSFYAMLPGIVVWGLGGGIAFTAVFVAAGSGVSPMEQGVASALASTSQQIGGAVILAAIVAVANAGLDVAGGPAPGPAAIASGLQVAGWIAGLAAVIGAFVTLALKKPGSDPAEARTSTAAA